MRSAGPRRVVPVFLPAVPRPPRLLDPPLPAVAPDPAAWPERATAQIEAALARHPGERAQLGLFGGSIGALPEAVRREVLALAGQQVERGRVDSVRVVLEPGDAAPGLLDELAAAHVSTLEIDAGSFDDEALAACGCSWRAADAAALLEAAASRFETGLILRPGMPGGTPAEILRTARRAIELAPRFVRVYPVLVLQGTELAHDFISRRYRPLSLEETIETCRELLRQFAEAGIAVSRLGFQPAVDLEHEAVVLAGPWHPSLRALAEAPLWFERAARLIAANFRFQKELTLVVHPRDESRLRGPLGVNARRLRDKFRLDRLQIVADEGVALGSLHLELPPATGRRAARIAG